MSLKSASRDKTLTTVGLIRTMSCVAVLVSVMTPGSDHKPNPGTRTAFRLLASEATRSHMQRAFSNLDSTSHLLSVR